MNEPILPDEILNKAVSRAATALGLSQEELGNNSVAQDREASLTLVRIYQALDALVGGDSSAIKHWMATGNLHFGGVAPIQLIQSIKGLTDVADYLDSLRNTP